MPELSPAPLGLSVTWAIPDGEGEWITPAIFVLHDGGEFDPVIVHKGRLKRASAVLPADHRLQIDLGLFLVEPDTTFDDITDFSEFVPTGGGEASNA